MYVHVAPWQVAIFMWRGKNNDIVIGFGLKHIRWLLLSDEDMHEVLLPSVVSAHEVGNCINIVTYCVIISVGLLSAGRANLSVEMHFKVLLCYDQENILLQTYLYRCDFCFCLFVFHKWRFTVLVIVLDPTVKLCKCQSFLFVHTLCIQCAFLYGDWILLRSAQLC